jgi:hypothetical protein
MPRASSRRTFRRHLKHRADNLNEPRQLNRAKHPPGNGGFLLGCAEQESADGLSTKLIDPWTARTALPNPRSILETFDPLALIQSSPKENSWQI